MHSKQAILTIALFLVFGTLATFAYKLQSSITVKEGQHQKKFFHPYMQCFTMFIGESLCLLLYLRNRHKNPTPLQQGKQPYKPWIFFIPALSDAFASTLGYMGLCFIESSTWMMFKGGSIVWTAIFSKILINITLEKRHFVGCGLAIIGVVIVGSSVFLDNNPSNGTSHDQQFIGYALMTVSLIFNGFFYAYEQYLFSKHSINPMQMVGYEGIFGMIITLLVATILSVIPCHFGQNNCVFNQMNEPYIELPGVFVNEVFDHIQLLILVICGLTALGVYNLNGLRITKMFDALTRALLNITKTAVIWIIGIFITVVAAGNKAYQIESLNFGVNFVKVIGFSIIIIGTLIYNKLIFKGYFSSQLHKQQIQFKQIVEEQTG